MQISALRSLSHPLNAPANPLAARVTAALHAPALRSSAEHLGEEAGREVVAVMHATHIHIESTEKWLSDPLTSSFTESSIKLDAARVHTWQSIGTLPAALVSQAHDPAAVRSMQIGAEDFPEDSLLEAAFTSVALSPRGVIADDDATINAAALVTDSRGGARIYTQSGIAQQWHVRVDMAAYLLRGYLAAAWGPLAEFDSTVQPVQPLPSVPNMVELNRRRQLVNVQCAAWSAKLQSRRGAPFVLVALGSKPGVVSVWKLALPIIGAPEASAADGAAAAAAAADASAAASSSAASDPARHPQLICTVTPSAGAHVFISQLSFSPLYFDSARQTTLCALAVGTSDGHAFVYGLQPEPSTDAAGAAAAASSSIASVAAAAAADPSSPAPVTLHLLASARVGSKLMAVSALCWNQILGGSAPTTVEDECAFCFGNRCEHRPVSGHGMSVHHVLAVGCGGQMQVHTFHPDLYASPVPAQAVDAEGEMADVAGSAAAPPAPAPAIAHPSLCRSFTKRHAHATVINSFVWSVQSTSTLHPPRSLDPLEAASVPRVSAECSPLSQHHLQLLSASNDDVVHRWILKDGVGSDGRGALLALDSNKLMDLAMFQPVDAALAAEAEGSSASPGLAVFPWAESAGPGSRPEPVHGSLGLLRSADGMLLHTYEVFVTGGAGLSVPNSSSDRKRFSMGLLRSAPFPFVDLTDDARESFARLAVEYFRISVGGDDADADAAAAKPPSRPESPTAALDEGKVAPSSGRGSAAPRSAIEIMQEELLEERRLEAKRAAGVPGALAAPALGAAVAASRGDHPVKMEIDTGDSPAPPASGGVGSASSALAPSTPQGVGRPRKSRGGAQSAKAPGSASASKSKKAKAKAKRAKRNKDGSDSDGESDESDEAWQEDSDEEGDGSASDESDDDEAHLDDEAKSASKRATRSVGVKSKAKSKTRQPFKRRANDTLYANACNVPVPLPEQSELLEQERISVQLDLLLHKFVPIWRDVVEHGVRSRIARQAHPAPSPSAPAASLSYFSLYTFIMALLNPLHLTMPPALSAVPTRVVLDHDEDMLLRATSSSSSRRNAPDPNPHTSFSLWWRMLPRVLPAGSVYGGYGQIFRDESEAPDGVTGQPRELPPLYPIDAFALPMHRQLPFIFGADVMLHTAENIVATLCPDVHAFQLLWLDPAPDALTPSSAVDPLQLRLALTLLQFSLSARSPFIAIGPADRTRAQTLQRRLLHVLHLQFIQRQMEFLGAPLLESDEAKRAETALHLANSWPLTALLLQADWLMRNLLEDRAVWAHPRALPLLRTLHGFFAAFHVVSQAELSWFQALALPPDAASPLESALVDRIVDHAAAWPATSREQCQLCDTAVPLQSSQTGTCASNHTLPRCRRTLLLLSGMQPTDACNICQGSLLRSAASDEAATPHAHTHLCPLCLGNTHSLAC